MIGYNMSDIIAEQIVKKTCTPKRYVSCLVRSSIGNSMSVVNQFNCFGGSR